MLDYLMSVLGEEYTVVLVIMIASLIGSKIVQMIIVRFLHRLTAKTKTDIDDKIIAAISKPIIITVILIGLQISLNMLTVLADYQSWVSMG
ncbi:MAG: hypothetical protein KKG13_01420, partial [Nanoarchaeota archaeon]|nr:hypothetical protein [Nanoarchaeota archaeon]